MPTYAVLGSGAKAKLLITTAGDARAITTADADVLHTLLPELRWLSTCMLGELHQAALRLNGEPILLRRLMLGHFDAERRQEPSRTLPSLPGIVAVAKRVAAIAHACRDLPAPVASALRELVADSLTGLDGVLVPAEIRSEPGRSHTCVRLVINPALLAMPEEDWLALLADGAENLDEFVLASLYDDVPAYLHDQCDIDTSMSDVLADARMGDGCEVAAKPEHVLAWLSQNRPHLLTD